MLCGLVSFWSLAFTSGKCDERLSLGGFLDTQIPILPPHAARSYTTNPPTPFELKEVRDFMTYDLSIQGFFIAMKVLVSH